MKADEHHPSCRPSDKDLVWLCSQCGAVEHATSEPQEWTPDKIPACLKSISKHDWGLICDAHEAEREKIGAIRHELATTPAHDVVEVARLRMEEREKAINEALQLNQQLAAEQRRADESFRENLSLIRTVGLLQDQLTAEREKVKQMRLEFERIVQFRHTYDEVISIARAALAKVKE